MKKFIAVVLLMTGAYTGAQTVTANAPRQISVTGEGKIMVRPDEAIITIGVVNNGADAAEVKKANDATVDKVIKYLKNFKLAEKDYQTQRVYLNRNYDYEKKRHYFTASQTITINLRDLSRYDNMIIGLTDAGVNNIQGIEFKTSKQEQYESEARVKAVADANKKAEDYAKALNLFVGYALVVNDNTQTNYPRPMYAMEMKAMADSGSQETLALGEIEITANVDITYELSITNYKR
ncbi:SIMPL domain-containing protein [Flavobacterium sp.]|uniref:SIMPL domain-containing protein n=1 Tax=Flavobacterium sp. TaxID=239 RepID=UPI0026063F04|nr:SIMPL domain-containing protein [Flavobacterium sp.]